uniref:Uncharacterized protein n=1 Tax=Tanacetum cinerariifolium TaxID=118510 RepID=A0A6L2KVI9_TANCI|nr:hypothetical protein [Tanacetum cinerariifolium]
MVTSSDVEDIVSKLSSDKAKSHERKRGPFLLDCSLRLYNWRYNQARIAFRSWCLQRLLESCIRDIRKHTSWTFIVSECSFKCSAISCSSDIYFIRGFGTVAWVNVSEYEALRPDKIVVDGGEQNLKVSCVNTCSCLHMRMMVLGIKLTSSKGFGLEVDNAALISIDSKGIDVHVRQGTQIFISLSLNLYAALRSCVTTLMLKVLKAC